MTVKKITDKQIKGRKTLPVLIFLQLIIAVLTVAIIVIVGLKIKPLIELKTDLMKQINEKSDSITLIEAEIMKDREQLRATREAVAYIKAGIDYYHQGDYMQAVDLYDQALGLDSLNAYVLNIKGYSLFKAKHLDEAIHALYKAVSIQPDYAWGYFDLARAYCAIGNLDLAKNAINTALKLQPGLAATMRKDGEFTHLCKPLLDILNEY